MSAINSPVLPGETIADKYRVERFLGQGGMGVVVAARHLELEQTVAIKFLCGSPPANARERFMREARAAAVVKSEHVCRVFDVGKLDSGEPYIVMEYLEGTDLSDKIAKEGRQPITDAVSWIIQACDALSSAHASNIVHRDLKPANLFLQSNPDGAPTIKVVDFGISKLPGQLTESIVVMGSPLYMSPEQLASTRDADARSDLWSLGVVLYELLTGKTPFSATNLVQLAVAVREGDPEPPRSARADIPLELERVILKCMAKSPDDRYATVYELVEDLRPFAGEDVAALAGKIARRGRRLSDPEINPLSKTLPREASSLPPSKSAAAARSADGQIEGKTLDAVQTASTNAHRSARWAFVAGIATVALVAGIVRLTMPRRDAGTPAALVVSTPPPSASSPAAVSGLTPVTLTESLPSATSAASATSPVASPVPHASVAPPATQLAVRKTNPNVASPRPNTTAEPAVGSSAGAVPVVAPGTTTGPKKRELDRDYKE